MSVFQRTVNLHGDLLDAGIRIACQDSDSGTPYSWGELLPSGYIHLILNLEGNGVVFGKNIRLSMVPATVGLCRTTAEEVPHASRLPGGGRHRFLVLSATPDWIAKVFEAGQTELFPALQRFFDPHSEPPDRISQLRSLNLAERDLCESMLRPPVPRGLRPVWFRAKAIECFGIFGVAPANAGSEGRSESIQRRIDEATVWLREHFADELDLAMLSRHVGCAPHYLSRLYKAQTGKTLTQKLREIRIDRAAQLLRSGRCNVTEAALEVGYSSLSHFTKAFVAEKGLRPSDFAHRV